MADFEFLKRKTAEAEQRIAARKNAWLNAKRKLAELDTSGNLKRFAETFGQADQNGRKRLHITKGSDPRSEAESG